jgi:hypothetical protein
MKKSIAKTVAQNLTRDPHQDIETAIRSAVKSQIEWIKFAWEKFEGKLADASVTRIENRRSVLASDRKSLERDAQARADQLFAEELGQARIRVELLARLARALGDQSVTSMARKTKRQFDQIAALGKEWPALTPPKPQQASSMKDFQEAVSHLGQAIGFDTPDVPAFWVSSSGRDFFHIGLLPGSSPTTRNNLSRASTWIEWGNPNPGAAAADLINGIDNYLFSLAANQKTSALIEKSKAILGKSYVTFRLIDDEEKRKRRIEAEEQYEKTLREKDRMEKELKAQQEAREKREQERMIEEFHRYEREHAEHPIL